MSTVCLRESTDRENRHGGLLILRRIIAAGCLIEWEMRRIIVQGSIMMIHLMKRQVNSILILRVSLSLWSHVGGISCFASLLSRMGINCIKRKMDRKAETGDDVEGKSIEATMGMVPRQTSAFGSIPFRSIFIFFENLYFSYLLRPWNYLV